MSELEDLREEVKQLRENIAAITFTSVDASQVTRFEVIDHTARNSLRAVVRHGVNVELSYQDDGRTLKVFLKDSHITNKPLATKDVSGIDKDKE